jgi:hypothetical protein
MRRVERDAFAAPDDVPDGHALAVTRSSTVTTIAARALSVVGHPALLMPAAVAWSAQAHGVPAPALRVAVGASVAVALGVMAFSLRQVRAGRWSHVDASVPRERGQLNVFLVLLLSGVAAALWAVGQPWPVPLGLALGGAVVLITHLLRRWLKVSLHASFAVYAAALLWPAALATGLVLLLAAAVSWSRLALRRHTLAEVAVGLAAGALAGCLFNVFGRY